MAGFTTPRLFRCVIRLFGGGPCTGAGARAGKFKPPHRDMRQPPRQMASSLRRQP